MEKNVSKILSSTIVSSIATGACFCLTGNVMPAMILASAVAGNSCHEAIKGLLNYFGHKKNKEHELLNDVFLEALGKALDSTVSIRRINQYKSKVTNSVCKEKIGEINNEFKCFMKNQSGGFRSIVHGLDFQGLIYGDTSVAEDNLRKYLGEKLSGCGNDLLYYVTEEIDFGKLRKNFISAVAQEQKAHFVISTLILKNQEILEVKFKEINSIARGVDDLKSMLADVIYYLKKKENFSQSPWGLIGDLSRIYTDSLSAKYGSMKVDFLEDGLQGDRSFNIKALYWPLKLKRFKDRYQEKDRPSRAGNYAPPEREKKEQLQISIEKFSIGAELQNNPRLVVLGEAGAGKSTLTAWLVIAELLRRNDDPSCKDFPDIEELDSVKNRLPVIIQCNTIKSYLAEDRGADFNEILDDYVKDLFRAQVIDKSIKLLVSSFLTENFNQGQVILIFDGLDEVQSEQKNENLIDLITQLAQKYTSVPIILTSRIEDYSQWTQGRLKASGFQHVEISSLSLNERDRFIDHWCCIKGTAQDELDAIVPQIKHSIRTLSHLKERTKNIFMLTIVAHLYLNGRSENLSNDGMLFHEAVKCFAYRKQERKLNKIRAFLGYIAYEMRKKRTMSIDIEDIIYLFEENRFYSKNPEEWLLRARKTGLLVGNDDIYTFSHDSFGDYFAGSAIRERKFTGYDRRSGGEVSHFIRILSGKVQKKYISGDKYEYIVVREWQAPIRYCLNICGDEDKMKCLLHMVDTDDDDNPEETGRARAVMALPA